MHLEKAVQSSRTGGRPRSLCGVPGPSLTSFVLILEVQMLWSSRPKPPEAANTKVFFGTSSSRLQNITAQTKRWSA